MGGSSSHEYGKLHVATEKDCYKAGDTITGAVYLKMEKPMPKGGTLMLKFKGWEKTKWTENLFDQTGINIFYRNSVQLYNWPHGSTIDAESFTFPFSLKTDANIPGSFLYKDDDGINAEIRYTIKAEILSHGTVPKMKNHTQVVIRENYDNYKENLYKEISQDCVTMYCCNQGFTKLGCQFEQYTYVIGEVADLVVAVDNSHCGLPVDSIEAKFLQTISLKDNKGQEKVLQKTLLKKGFGRVEPHVSQVGSQSNKIALPLISNNKPFEPSTSGDIIICKYDLMVKCQMAGPCMEAEPKVKANVFLYPAPLSDFGKVQPPPGFAPKVMPAFTFALSPDTQYARKDGSQVVLKIRTGVPGQIIFPTPPVMHTQNQVVPINTMGNAQTQRPPENQPLLSNQMNAMPQPVMNNNQQPGNQTQTTNEQPETNISQPYTDTTNQQLQNTNQPQMMNQQPQMINQQPQIMNQQPQIMNQQPQIMNQQPQMMNQQPHMMNQQPQMMSQPQMMNQQPQGMYQQPQMMNHQPQGMYQQPQMMNQKPMMNQQPQGMYQQPQMMQQPMMMNQQPMMNQQIPTAIPYTNQQQMNPQGYVMQQRNF